MGDKNDKKESKDSSADNNANRVHQGKIVKRQFELKRRTQIPFITYFVVLFLLLMYLLINFWPESVEIEEITISDVKEGQVMEESKSTAEDVYLFRGLITVSATGEVRFIIIVAIMGALGGCAYATNAFVYHVSRKTFKSSYACWYALRPLVGSILAVIFYFAFRAAFFSLSASTGDINSYGIATLGGIVGLFSWETLKKLEELFNRIIPVDQGQEVD